jgi:excisionase family DNA binding protein
MANEPEILLSIGAVAKRLGVSPSTIRNWTDAGKLPAGMRIASEGRREGLRAWRRDQIETVALNAEREERSAASAA